MTTFPILTLQNSYGTATVTPYGGCVLSYIPAGGTDVLWQTTPELLEKAFQNGKALRAGVPVCWPWFRNHPTNPKAPSHGFGRIKIWEVAEQSASRAILNLATDGTDPDFPFNCTASLLVELSDTLNVALTTTNTGHTAFPITQALHTYLGVAEVSQVALHGLANTPRNHISSGTELAVHTEPLTIAEETEILYRGVQGTITVDDPANHRRIAVCNTPGADAAIWNPWIEKTKTLDMLPEGYTNMLCVEAVQANAVTVQPGQSIALATTLQALHL